MKKRLAVKIARATLLCALLGITAQGFASAFQLLEQSAAGTGDGHAGGAAEANDASTGFYNPAGLTRIHHPQITAGGSLIITDIQFNGEGIRSNEFFPASQSYSAVGKTQAGNSNVVPNFHIALPITKRLVLGFGVTVPFGLSTTWPETSIVRYYATDTVVKTINLSPSFGYALTKNFSIGAGWDAMRLSGTFDEMAGASPTSAFDTLSINKATGWAYGYHLGMLWQATPKTRVGVSFRSSMKTTASGHSTFSGPLATTQLNGQVTARSLFTTVTLPATTTFSIFHDINNQWAVMASAFYTQWDVFNTLTLNNVVTVNGIAAQVIVPQNFRNTWNFAVGTHYKVNRIVTLKAGLGFDQTPTTNAQRNIRLPDADRIALSFGSHFQMTKALGVDVGWTHLFVHNAPININNQPVGRSPNTEFASTIGNVKSHADIIGGQITWNMV